MKLIAYITWRYIRGAKKYFISLQAILSFTGVFIGTSLLVVVLSVFNGFQAQIKKSIFQFDPHITIEKNTQPAAIGDYYKWINKIKIESGPGLKDVKPMIQSAALVRVASTIDHIFIRGQSFESSKDKKSYILPKDFPHIVRPKNMKTLPKGRYCIIGREMAINMDIRLGDQIALIVPRGQFTARLGMVPRMRRYKVAGLFKTGHYQHDSRVVVISHESAQDLYDLKFKTQQIAVHLNNLDKLDYYRYQINKIFPIPFYVHTVEDDQRNFFAALRLEKTIMTIIVFLFIIAAMVGVVVATQHTVRSKKKDIGILKALGMGRSQVGMIFMLNGFIMGAAGSILGIMFGVFLALKLENIVNFVEMLINFFGSWYAEAVTGEFWIDTVLIPRDVYYFDHLPISIEQHFLMIIAIVSIVLAALASFVPAWMASRMEPMEIIRRGDQ